MNKIVVIKFGGSIASDGAVRKLFYQDIVHLRKKGYKLVICHGGGPEINGFLKRLGIEPRFIHGLRVTDAQTMEIVEMVLSGKINRELVGSLNHYGAPAVGLSGKDANLLIVEKIKASKAIPNLGFVGKVKYVSTKVLLDLLPDYVVVVSSVGIDRRGQTYNINADTVATRVAQALSGSRLILLTDVKGVLADARNENSTIAEIKAECINALIQEKVVTGGMIPKIKACREVLLQGVKEIDIVNGRIPHVLLKTIAREEGLGTRFVNPALPGSNPGKRRKSWVKG